MKFIRRNWKVACLIVLVGLVVFFVTIGREPLNQGLHHLRQWGPLPFFAVFALCISFGVPPTPFLLAAGAAFDFWTNLVGFTLSYAVSLIIAYTYAQRLFKQRLDAFLAAKSPLISGLLRENWMIATVMIRLTPGFPYVLQNCLLVTVCRSSAAFVLVSLAPIVALAMLYASLGSSLTARRYGVLALFAALLCGVVLVFRFVSRRRAFSNSTKT